MEEELISFYLCNKLEGRIPDIDRVIPVVDIYDHHPAHLPRKFKTDTMIIHVLHYHPISHIINSTPSLLLDLFCNHDHGMQETM